MRYATLDPTLDFHVVTRRRLLYGEGPDPALDRPAHVRAASAMARLPDGRLAIVQDDSLFVAFVRQDGIVDSLTLPAGPDGKRAFDDIRGNKHHKLDLEACFATGDRLIGFGSGSTPARERVVIVDEGRARVVDAHALYEAFRSATDFSGSELNIEGTARMGTSVVFASRGNGAPRNGLAPIDATCRIDLRALEQYLGDPSAAAPRLQDVCAYDLGSADGARLTFTDLASDGTRLFYAACAEASPDAVRDGPVSAVAIGVLDAPRAAPRYGLVHDERGRRLTDKIEGLVVTADARLLAVIDVDDPTRPAELLELRVSGAPL